MPGILVKKSTQGPKSPKQNLAQKLVQKARKFPRVTFHKIVRKKNVTPLKDKPKNVIRLPEDSNQSEPNSFVVLTDPTISYRSISELTSESILSLSCQSKRRRRRSNLYESDDFDMIEKDENKFMMSDFFSPRPKKRSSQILRISSENLNPTSQDLFPTTEEEITIVAEVPSSKGSTQRSTQKEVQKPSKNVLKGIDSAPFSGLVHVNWNTVNSEEKSEFKQVPLLEVPAFPKDFSYKDFLAPEVAQKSVKTVLPKKPSIPSRPLFKKYFQAGQQRKKNLDTVAEYIPWTDAFGIQHREDIFSEVDWHYLKEWMQSWSKKLDSLQSQEQGAPPPKKKKKSQDEDEDYEEEQTRFDEMENTFVVFGPTGSGKTSIVKYCAQKTDFKVLELSASDLRSASVLKKTLTGAIESFAVRKSHDIRAMFGQTVEGPKKTLILIDDADVIFQVDNGFWSRLNSIRMESKIPIVLTCTNGDVVKKNLDPGHCFSTGIVVKPLMNIVEYLTRKPIPSKSNTIATDEIFVLQKIDEMFRNKQTTGRLSGRRVLHPFSAVDHNLGYSLDQMDRLRGSIVSYSNWPDHGVEGELKSPVKDR